VRTRTYLTTPPGQRPTDATGRAEADDERYVPALDLPSEPRVAGRHRRLLLVLSVVTTLVLVVGGLFLLVTASQGEDPALSDPAMPPPDEAADEGPSLRG
jgi:hypothetical protein